MFVFSPRSIPLVAPMLLTLGLSVSGCGRTELVDTDDFAFTETDESGETTAGDGDGDGDPGDGDGDPGDGDGDPGDGDGECGDAILDPVSEECDEGEQNGVEGSACKEDCTLNFCGDFFLGAGEECDEGPFPVPGPEATCAENCQLNFCGDGFLGQGEECDLGFLNGVPSSDCTAECALATCGDGVLSAGEQCDLGPENGSPTSPCNSSCQLNNCGDGEIGPGESCDDGNTLDGDGCSSSCQLELCGNFQIEGLETCDDGPSGSATCDPDCTAVECGDGVFNDLGEFCDDGAFGSFTCDPDCTEVECGDGVTNPFVEACDAGAQNGVEGQDCLLDCTLTVCGDGFQGASEDCDAGADNGVPGSGCTLTCTLEAAFCGDGALQTGEACDLGPLNSDNGDCTTACQLPTCGDGLVWDMMSGAEVCDGTNLNGEDCTTQGFDGGTLLCNPFCTGFSTAGCSSCGDGFAQTPEECDTDDFFPGASSCVELGFDQGSLSCTASCALDTSACASCGDGVITAPEACDGATFEPGSETCQDFGFESGTLACTGCAVDTSDCATCGNGTVESGEVCDDGNTVDGDACSADCQTATTGCGNGVIESPEECDDGAANGPDADCTPLCTIFTCGDTFLHPTEQCDPGSALIGPGQECLDGCIDNVCGDGDKSPSEQCDDGNTIDTDACTSGCISAFCGDTIVHEGVEECDDGNFEDLDDCHNDCSRNEVVLAIGGNHACALADWGALRCWGNGNNGRTGQLFEINYGDDEPARDAPFIPLPAQATSILASRSHTCVNFSGELRCFGRAAEGQLGYGNVEDIGDDEAAMAGGPVPLGFPVAEAYSRGGSLHGCALDGSGAVMCWGGDLFGGDVSFLGYPGLTENLGDNEFPSTQGFVDVGGVAVQISTGERHTCVLLDTGAVRCWGLGTGGRLGYGNENTIGDDETPASAGDVPLGGTAVQISSGWFHNCALMDTGNVRCWGINSAGQLGYGFTAFIGDNETPADIGDVDLAGDTIVAVESGRAHTCALTDTGTVRCWGGNSGGELGTGNTESIGDNELPSSIGPVDLGGTAIRLYSDTDQNCVVMSEGGVRCWGRGGDGRLGYGNTNNIGDDETPASVGNVPLY